MNVTNWERLLRKLRKKVNLILESYILGKKDFKYSVLE